MIYVSEQPNRHVVMQAFQRYCQQNGKCLLLDKNNQYYQSVRNFIGHSDKQYFVILDPNRQQKFVLQIDDYSKFHYQNIFNFQAAFTSRKLKPFYSSQEIPSQFYQPCQKLVGKNFEQFINLKSLIKVVYLHTQQPSCSLCGQILRNFADIAQKIYREDVISFGYFDIFKNDHPLIPHEITPYFLIFKSKDEEPYGIQGEKINQLQKALINIIAEQIYPNYRKQSEINSELNIQDLQLSQPQEILNDQTEHTQNLINIQL